MESVETVAPVGTPTLKTFHINNTRRETMKLKDWKLFITEERSSYEDEERNLHCICGELKTKCPDGYAHTTGGA